MPVQYDYPDEGWSTGTMRKVGDKAEKAAQVGQPLTPEEWQDWWGKKNWQVYGEAGKVNPSKAGPDGILIRQGHPQIKDLENQGWTTHDIPDLENNAGSAWKKDYQFMRPPMDDKTPVAAAGPGRAA